MVQLSPAPSVSFECRTPEPAMTAAHSWALFTSWPSRLTSARPRAVRSLFNSWNDSNASGLRVHPDDHSSAISATRPTIARVDVRTEPLLTATHVALTTKSEAVTTPIA